MDSASPAGSKSLFYLKRITGLILLLALAATFFYSAYTKSGVEFKGFWLVETPKSGNAFDSFQWTFFDLGINSVLAAGVIARLMIGFEFLLGLFLLFHIFLKKFTYRAILVVLSVFIIYLLMVIWKQGNTGNCGCFGDSVSMTPLQAIWKNLIMMAVTIVLMFIYPVKGFYYQEYICLIIGCAAFSTPFVVNFIYTGTDPEVYKEKQVDMSLLYKYDPAPEVDLRKGKRIVAFMSLTCPHCRKAAYLMHIIHLQHPEIPMYIVFDGAEVHKKSFFDETHAEDVPHLYYHHTTEFMDLSGPGVPAIYWLNNGKIEFKSTYYQLDPKHMIKWMKSP